jgi:surfeit locus 1 family protein
MTRGTRGGGRRTLPLLVAAGLAFVVLVGLGTWQVQRLAWKEGLIAAIEARTALEPVPVDAILRMIAAGEAIDYRPATVTGRFEHDREQYFLATYRGASGWHVYTPLVLVDGRRLFVNRGFVPYDRRDPESRPEGRIEGEVTVSGLARAAPAGKPSAIVPDNEPGQRTYYWKDLKAMREAAGIAEVLPFFLDAGPDPVPGGLPVGGVTLVELPNNHLQYAITWYGLALALAGVLTAWLRQRRRRSS